MPCPIIRHTIPASRRGAVRSVAWLAALAGTVIAGFVPAVGATEPPSVRVMTFNASMNRPRPGQLLAELRAGTSAQIRRVAEIIQFVRPDVVVINEFDHDDAGEGLTLFHDNFLAVSQNGRAPIEFPHRFTAPSNTGAPSGFDLDGNGSVDTTPGDNTYGNDCFGFGTFPGQYGMAALSRHPIGPDGVNVRTFRTFRWAMMPGNLIPPGFYSSEAEAALRLSSKSHWDLPVSVGGRILHLLVSHPTPPVFDGPEDRNGRRNHDEIRFWADFISPARARYMTDDAGVPGGLPAPARFVILGDLNADPDEGDSFPGAIDQLLDHPQIDAAFTPVGSVSGDDTATFNGRLRVDYVLPSRLGLHVDGGAVVWPRSGEPLADILGGNDTSVSDHRPVYLDLTLLPFIAEAVDGLRIRIEGSGGDRSVVLEWRIQSGVEYAVAHNRTPDGNDATWKTDPAIQIVVDASSGTARAEDRLDPERRYYRIEAWFPGP